MKQQVHPPSHLNRALRVDLLFFMPIPYNKPHLSYPQKLQLLKERGLSIDDDSKALHLLEHIGYYRLSGYWYPLLDFPKKDHKFKEQAKFSTVYNLYCFDNELKQLVSTALAKIEISVRAKMIYNLWENHGAFWHIDDSLFRNPDIFQTNIEKFKEQLGRSKEDFIKSFKQNYSDPIPPSCMMLEISSFGTISSLYRYLKNNSTKRKIAKNYGLSPQIFTSWLHTLCYIRNICAHHSRLWNRILRVIPKIPHKTKYPFILVMTLPKRNRSVETANGNNRVYFMLSMILYFLNTIEPENEFKSDIYKLLAKYPEVDKYKGLGFTSNWQNEPIWST